MIQDIKLYLLENNTGQIPGVKENPRDLTGDGFAKAKQSIKDFPEMLEVRTLVAVKHEDRFVVIGGNQRLRAMRDLDHDTAPVMVVDWPVDKINEFIIKDNVEYGVWNFDLLANEWDVQELMDWGLEVNVDLEDINDITEGLTDENEVPEILPNPKSKIGDVWICGNHRLMCGDSTSIDAVEKLMAGTKADVLFTDPPYGIDFKPPRGTHDKILNDNLEGGDFDDFLDGVFGSALSVMNPDTYAFVWTGWSKIGAFERSLRKFFKIQAMHIWVKNNFGIGYYSRPKHEPFYLCLNGKPVYPSAAPADVWNFARVHKTIHSCEKPVGLIENILDTYHKNSTVLDLFGGSGSTLIACQKTGRKAYLMELDPKYCDVIIKRWQDFTGKDAILESTQQKFNEL